MSNTNSEYYIDNSSVNSSVNRNIDYIISFNSFLESILDGLKNKKFNILMIKKISRAIKQLYNDISNTDELFIQNSDMIESNYIVSDEKLCFLSPNVKEQSSFANIPKTIEMFCESDAESINIAESESDAESEINSDAESEINSDAESEINSDAESEINSDAESEINSDAESEINSDAESEINSDAESEINSDAESKSNSNTESEINSDAKSINESDNENNSDDISKNIASYKKNFKLKSSLILSQSNKKNIVTQYDKSKLDKSNSQVISIPTVIEIKIDKLVESFLNNNLELDKYHYLKFLNNDIFNKYYNECYIY